MLHIVYGGSASGKSSYAESFAMSLQGEGRLLYIATMYPYKWNTTEIDPETMQRIERHRAMRADKGFDTVECYRHVEHIVAKRQDVLLLECMSNLLANEMYLEPDADDGGRPETMSEVEKTGVDGNVGSDVEKTGIGGNASSDMEETGIAGEAEVNTETVGTDSNAGSDMAETMSPVSKKIVHRTDRTGVIRNRCGVFYADHLYRTGGMCGICSDRQRECEARRSDGRDRRYGKL